MPTTSGRQRRQGIPTKTGRQSRQGIPTKTGRQSRPVEGNAAVSPDAAQAPRIRRLRNGVTRNISTPAARPIHIMRVNTSA